ncbi:MAG: hypothetical protein MAG795_00680 [Candidatus Woesearchaeota archaeon]|nr:hypothetical protein [Candidatus Woesearchaeota archaeon]
MKKASVSLSVNFLVMMIVGISVLSLGIILVKKMEVQANKWTDDVSKETENQIRDLLDTGDIVVAPINVREVQRGKDIAKFAVGIRNIQSDANNFIIEVESTGVNGCLSNSDWVLLATRWKEGNTIDRHESVFAKIGVKVPKNKKSCKYVFNVRVYSKKAGLWESYGTPLKLYVDAK